MADIREKLAEAQQKITEAGKTAFEAGKTYVIHRSEIRASIIGAVIAAILAILFYEGLPNPFRGVPVIGKLVGAVSDGRVDRVRQRAVYQIESEYRIALAQAMADARKKIADARDKRLAAERLANAAFEQRREASLKAQNLEDEINELLSKPVPDTCTVSPDLLRRLRQY